MSKSKNTATDTVNPAVVEGAANNPAIDNPPGYRASEEEVQAAADKAASEKVETPDAIAAELLQRFSGDALTSTDDLTDAVKAMNYGPIASTIVVDALSAEKKGNDFTVLGRAILAGVDFVDEKPTTGKTSKVVKYEVMQADELPSAEVENAVKHIMAQIWLFVPCTAYTREKVWKGFNTVLQRLAREEHGLKMSIKTKQHGEGAKNPMFVVEKVEFDLRDIPLTKQEKDDAKQGEIDKAKAEGLAEGRKAADDAVEQFCRDNHLDPEDLPIPVSKMGQAELLAAAASLIARMSKANLGRLDALILDRTAELEQAAAEKLAKQQAH